MGRHVKLLTDEASQVTSNNAGHGGSLVLQDIVQELYSAKPTNVLYHYTSLSGLMGIVDTRSLWISEIRYLNDAEELRHLGRWLSAEIASLLEKPSSNADVLQQLRNWLPNRLEAGPKIFVGSFTENGNLLSQWRGYCPHGRGVSVGFAAEEIIAAAGDQDFLVGKCIYDTKQKHVLAERIIKRIVSLAVERGPDSKKHPLNSYHGVFSEVEPDLLGIAAVIKDASFHEEKEWRVVSPVHSNYAEAQIMHREGAAMLIPYMELRLPVTGTGSPSLAIERVYVGPTPNVNLSIDSLCTFLARARVKNVRVSNSCIPYRG